jgi:hypothetical protein
MAAINANIVVESTNLTLTQASTNLGVTVQPINLGVYAGALATPGGTNGQLQFNDNSSLGGVANTSVASGNITFTNLANLKIDGGTNAYYLQTDGTGNLTWAAGGTPTGSGTPSGANTQIQLSDGSGSFDSGAGFTFDNVSNVFSAPGNVVTTGVFVGDGYGISNIAGANVVGLDTSKISNGTSNVSIATAGGDVVVSVNGISNVASFFTGGANVNGDLNVVSDITSTFGMFTGDGGGLSNIAGANLTGTITATTAGTVTSASQPNITSIGTLTSLNVAGTTTIQQAKEKVVQDATAATGTVDYDLLTSAIVLQTSDALADFTLNVRGNATTTLNSVMSTDQSMTLSFINQNGATAYVMSDITIDGSATTVKWIAPGNAGVGTVSGNDFYTLNIIKTAASTFKVYASRVGYS